MVGRICGGDGAREDGVKTVDHGVDSTGLVTDIVEFVSKVTMTMMIMATTMMMMMITGSTRHIGPTTG